jgi:hypothetical protein
LKINRVPDGEEILLKLITSKLSLTQHLVLYTYYVIKALLMFMYLFVILSCHVKTLMIMYYCSSRVNSLNGKKKHIAGTVPKSNALLIVKVIGQRSRSQGLIFIL